MENKIYNPAADFNSGLTKAETLIAVFYLPVHLYIVPLLLGVFAVLTGTEQNSVTLNFYTYLIGVFFLLIAEWNVLRRDYDILAGNLGRIVLEILAAYFAMMAMNMLVSIAFQYITPVMNPNNEAVIAWLGEDYGMAATTSIFFAPIVEELIFRAGIFGWARKHGRVTAYVIGVLAFSLYHVIDYAFIDWRYLFYIIQYLPVSFVLCRAYERTGSIWTGIFLHMLVNSVAFYAVEKLSELAVM